ncbi:hypothetical protein [Thalassomonas sp. M1454]|uniref:hypothetical protein n=1 Tax=Thalassomonas sp. M1454 TaxID=2594477 RepID=UPI00117C356F|nr:hypothetical protein [Thalassomonas sp. M1454]TRX52748.1 hypothetical protein FNN08_15415 [Thalassomonas sp. M1454]
MKPSKPLGKYIDGLKTALKKYSATQRDQYSWIAKTEEHYLFTAETDHIDRENNNYSHGKGIFTKKVRPLSKELGDASLTVSHGKELYDAAKQTFMNGDYCRLLLVKGTKYGTSSGGVKAVIDNDLWKFSKFEGSVDRGFDFVLERVDKI